MGFSFEQEGLDEETEESAQEELSAAADEVVNQIEEPTPAEPVEDDDQYMLDVDRRLEVAHFYRLLLKNSLFSEASEASEVVEREIRAFIRGQLEVLLSIRQPDAVKVVMEERKPLPADILTEDEVRALKMVASKLIRKPELAEVRPAAPPAPPPPVAKPAPKPPAVKPAVVAVTAKPATIAPAKAPTGKKPGPKPGQKKAAPEVPGGQPGEKIVLIEHPDHPGHMVESRKAKIQKPTGYVPMPTDNNAMAGILHQRAAMTSSISQGTMPVSNALAQIFLK